MWRLSFQITVLKVLAGHPGGHASLGEVRHAVSLLISSGSDWTDRMKRLAALAPGLDIFSLSFVRRDAMGWQITDGGRAFLVLLERAEVPVISEAPHTAEAAQVIPVPSPTPMRLIGTKRRHRRRMARRNRRLVA